MKKPVVLRIYKGEHLLGVKQFLDSQIVVGRQAESSEVQVPLDGESVSIIHAAIEDREGVYFVSDLGSVSGTFKNGEPVLDAQLESGDVLRVGEYNIEFYIGAPKPRAPGQTVVTSAPPPPTVAQPPVRPPIPVSTPTPTQPAVPPQPPPLTRATVPLQPPTASPTPTPTPTSIPTSIPVSPPIIPVRPPTPGTPTSPSASQTSNPKPSPILPKTPSVMPRIERPKPIPPISRPAGPDTASGNNPGSGGSFNLAGQTIGRPPPAPTPMSGTRNGIRSTQAVAKNLVKGRRRTFAPPGKYTDVKEFIRPSKGTIVEVLVAWGERIIASYHFAQAETITIGSHPDNHIVLPLLSSRVRKLPILQIDKQAVVLVTPEMRGELIRGQTSSSFADLMRQNRLVKSGAGQAIALEQGEMIKLELSDQVSVMIRFVSDSPKPLMAPILDLTASETTGVVLALALVATLWLYMYLYQAAKPLPDQEDNQPLRTALIVLTPPTPPPLPPPVPTPPPLPVVEKPTPVPTPIPQKVHVAEKTQVAQKKAPTVTNLTTKVDNGKSASAAPNKNKTGPRIQTSVKQGGAIKTTPKEGAQLQSKSRDMSKAGVFSVFGNNGAQDKLAQSTTGSGELAGMANQATGKAGSAVDRAGEGLGSELKDTGVGGTGKSLEGIAGGVGTQGRGSGNAGYGTGGLGNRQGVKIVTGGAGEDIQGTIDKDAIRRVIKANLNSIRACYNKELNKHPDLLGKIVLTWEIGEQGRVLSASTKSNELGDKEVADCILAKLRTWRFPEPPANQVAEVSYPFFFSN